MAGNDHAIRKGLDDANGWAIGTMSTSYASGVAFMALDDSFTSKVLVHHTKTLQLKAMMKKSQHHHLGGN